MTRTLTITDHENVIRLWTFKISLKGNLKLKIYQQSLMLINLINSVIAKKVLNSSVYLKPFAMKTVVCFIISVLFKLKFQGTIKKRFVIAVIRHTLIANLYIIFWRIRYKIISGQCIKLSLVIKLILPSFRKKNITFLLI